MHWQRLESANLNSVVAKQVLIIGVRKTIIKNHYVWFAPRTFALVQNGALCTSAHTSLGFFLHGPNLLVWLTEAPKQILCSLLTQCFIYFLIYLTIKINPTTFSLSNFGRPSFAGFWSKLTQNFTKKNYKKNNLRCSQ